MPSLISNRFYQPNYSGLNQGVSEGLRFLREDRRVDQALALQEEEKKRAARINALKSDGAQMMNLIDVNGLNAKKAGLARIANAAYERGEDVSMYEEAFAIDNPDKLDLWFTQFATGVRDANTALEDAIKARQPGEGFTLKGGETRFDAAGNPIASVEDDDAKPQTDAGKVIADREMIIEQFGEDSPQLAAFEEMLEAINSDDDKLTAKDIAGINDKVTALTKDVNDIVSAANSLDALKGRGTPSSKIAAIFKFMKTMDPTSTVRESEGKMVMSAEGAMKGFANRINEMLGEGPLSEAGFADLVDTSKVMANSAISESQRIVSSYLGVLKDKLPAEDFEEMNARIPAAFDVPVPGGGDLSPEEQAELEARREAKNKQDRGRY